MRSRVPTIERIGRLAAVVLAVTVGLAAGCGGNSGSAPGIDIEMFGWVENPPEGTDACDGLDKFRGGFCDTLTEYPDAHVMNVKLTRPLKREILSRSQHEIGGGEARISGLEVGTGLRLDFDLVDDEGRRLASGATPMFDLQPNASEKSFYTMLMPPENFAPVGARYGNSSADKGWAYEPTTFDGRVSGGKYVGRVGHATVTTQKGNVLIVGGGHHSGSRSPWATPNLKGVLGDVQLFEPGTGYVTDLSLDPTSVPPANNAERRPDGGGRLAEPRAYHTVTAIGDDQYIVIGGFTLENGNAVPTDTIELIDMSAEPGNRVRKLVDSEGNPVELNVPRAYHTATYRRQDDHIVVAGGVGGEGAQDVLKSIELITFADTIAANEVATLKKPRADHEAVLLGEEDSPIWILGGRGAPPPDGFGSWDSTELVRAGPGGAQAKTLMASMSIPRYQFAAARVGPTQVVVCGGYTSTEMSNGAPTAQCQVGNRLQGQWSSTWKMDTPRGGLEMVALTQSRDLSVLGGRDKDGNTVATPTRIDYVEGSSPPYTAEPKSADMQRPRYGASVTHLRSGLILLTGGVGQEASLRNMEYYNPLDIVRARDIDMNDGEGNSSNGG